jgi:hypothetical protein
VARSAVGVEDLLSGTNISGKGRSDSDSGSDTSGGSALGEL